MRRLVDDDIMAALGDIHSQSIGIASIVGKMVS